MTPKRIWNGNQQALGRRLVPLGDLKTFPGNPRRGDVSAIADSLTRFGQYRPIVVQPDGTILAGNHTYLAAQSLGWTHIAVVESDIIGDDAKALVLADNRLHDVGSYDDAELVSLLREVGQAHGTLEGTGFDTDDFRALERELARLALDEAADADGPAPSPPAEPRSQCGEVYELGPHRLLCGDSTSDDDVALLLDGREPCLLATDPPYGVELEMEWRNFKLNPDERDLERGWSPGGPTAESYMREEGHRATSISGDTRSDWSEAYELVPSLSIAYVWHADRYSHIVAAGLERIGFDLLQMVIWDKGQMVLSRTMYHFRHEPCWVARRHGAKVPFFGANNQTTIWEAASPKRIGAKVDDGKFDHPTQKPVTLFSRPIENHVEVGEFVYDPFGGSGTTLIAAEMTGRAACLMELDPAFCDVIRDRYEAFVTARAAA